MNTALVRVRWIFPVLVPCPACGGATKKKGSIGATRYRRCLSCGTVVKVRPLAEEVIDNGRSKLLVAT